jgi:malonyl-CoA decarboxylase
VPGLNRWLDTLAASLTPAQLADKKDKLAASVKLLMPEGETWTKRVTAGWQPAMATAEEKAALMRLCFVYLSKHVHSAAGDSVAKFHLANGAELHNINWAADLSKKGLAQSSAIMVNYLYELNDIEPNNEKFLKKIVVYSKNLDKLF